MVGAPSRLDLITQVGDGGEGGLGQLSIVGLEADQLVLLVPAASAALRILGAARFPLFELVEFHLVELEEGDLLGAEEKEVGAGGRNRGGAEMRTAHGFPVSPVTFFFLSFLFPDFHFSLSSSLTGANRISCQN